MKVKLTNVGVINSCEVEFIPGINIIVGSSGSGKSTLLRSIHNIAVNNFSDSDISFGKNEMNISIVCDDNTIEYSRFLKSHGDKFYYIINGEKYSKVGRQSLQAANDILKIGDINISGDDINFNFNMQFSTPFLIFGSQSTLYNVLTYRSQFDISKINEYYNSDVKTNNTEINTALKVRDQLNESLSDLENQEKNLRPVEELFSNYTLYKHTNLCLNEVYDLLNKISSINSCESSISNLSRILSEINNALSIIELLTDITNCKYSLSRISDLSEIVNKVSFIDNDYMHAESTFYRLNDVLSLNDDLVRYDKENNSLDTLKSLTSMTESMLRKNEFLRSLLEIERKLIFNDKLHESIIILSLDASSIKVIDDLITANNLINDLLTVDSVLLNTNNLLSNVASRLSEFEVCPLCGSCLHLGSDHERR